jgi:hypothetical protein
MVCSLGCPRRTLAKTTRRGCRPVEIFHKFGVLGEPRLQMMCAWETPFSSDVCLGNPVLK